jgi:hypothetical protein
MEPHPRNSGLDIGKYLEPMGFVRRDNLRDGVTAYTLRHVPLAAPVGFVHTTDGVHAVAWASVHVRLDATGAIPFWRVPVSPGHDECSYNDLQMDKIVRLEPDMAEPPVEATELRLPAASKRLETLCVRR